MREILNKSEVEKAVLEVDTENVAAISFYKKVGFTTQGIRKKYYEGKKDAYLMTLTK
jgi:ribosomal protein S18 acetylase RimI-like enzyme